MQTPPPIPHRSRHLDIKDTNWSKKMMGAKLYISHHIAFGRHRRPKRAFWAPINSTFIKTGQIARIDWNWPGAHLLHKWFFCAILSFWDMIDFVFSLCNAFRTCRNLKKKIRIQDPTLNWVASESGSESLFAKPANRLCELQSLLLEQALF